MENNNLKKENKKLKEEIKYLKNELQNLNQNYIKIRKDSEKLECIFGFIDKIKSIRGCEEGPDRASLIEDITFIDTSPLIKIKNFQCKILNKEKKGTRAARLLVEFLFNEDETKNMSFASLKSIYPDECKAIMDYCLNLATSSKSEIVKAITSKLRGK